MEGEGESEEVVVGGSDGDQEEDVVVGAPKKKSRKKLEMRWTGHPWLPACVVYFAGYEITDPQHRPPFSWIAAQLNSIFGVKIKEIHQRENACVNSHHIQSLYSRWVFLSPAARLQFDPDLRRNVARKENMDSARQKKADKMEQRHSLQGRLKTLACDMQGLEGLSNVDVSQQYICFEGDTPEPLVVRNVGKLTKEQAAYSSYWSRLQACVPKANLERATERNDDGMVSQPSNADLDLLQS